MVFWDRQDVHYLMSADKRKKYLYNAVSRKTFKFLNFLSFIFNVIIALIVYRCVGFNLPILGIVFIVSDIVLNILDQLIFVSIPCLLTKIKSINILKYRLTKIERVLNKTEHKIKVLKAKYCDDCGYSYDRSTCYRCKTMDRLKQKKRRLNNIIENEKEYILQLEANKKQNCSKEKKTTDNIVCNDVKENYFSNIEKKFATLIEKEKLYFLIGLRKNTHSISQILRNKPEAETVIPLSLYIKLDDMFTVANTYVELSQEEKKEQFEMVKNFANSLIKETQTLIVQMNRSRTLQTKDNVKQLLNKYNIQEAENV